MVSIWKHFPIKPYFAFTLIALTVPSPRAQEGVWKDIFNGKDLTGLKQNKNGTVTVNATDKIIEVSGGDGYLYTEAEYTHYRARVEWKNIGGGNTGYLHHIDLTKLSCNWPSGPELQMKQGNVGEIWTTDCKFNTTVKDSKFTSTGGTVTAIGQYGCGRTNFLGATVSEKVGDWNAWEIYVNGDSLEIKVNGAVVMRFSKLTTTGNAPMVKGHMALQIEGSKVQWRNWQVMDLSIPSAIVPLSRSQNRTRVQGFGTAPGFNFTREGVPGESQVEIFSATGRKSSITAPSF